MQEKENKSDGLSSANTESESASAWSTQELAIVKVPTDGAALRELEKKVAAQLARKPPKRCMYNCTSKGFGGNLYAAEARVLPITSMETQGLTPTSHKKQWP